MKKELDDYLIVTRIMGGMIKTMTTGVYPDKLKIYSPSYDKSWSVNVKEEIQNGSLRLKRKIVYNYRLENDRFYLQEVSDKTPTSDWVNVDMNIIMED